VLVPRRRDHVATTLDYHNTELLVFSRSRKLLLALNCLALPSAGIAQALAPAAPDPLLARADSLSRDKKYAEAAKILEQLIQKQPNQFPIWVRLGIARQLGGERDAAMTAYQKAITLGAGQTAKYNLGTLFALKGKSDSAFYWLEESVKAGYLNESQLTTDPDLASLRKDARYTKLVANVHQALAPCMTRPESRMFDFWIGEWDVKTQQGQMAGQSSVQLLLEGCALYENWSTPNGGGKSLNSYNPALKMWQQFWTDQTGRVTEYRNGEWVNGSLRLTAETHATTGPQFVRMTFTQMNKDLVRQFGEASADSGKTWAPTFDLYYHRKK
jgi:tetratricopeptide (TPR) repeat protein